MTLANSSVRIVSIEVIFTGAPPLTLFGRMHNELFAALRPLVIYHNMFMADHGLAPRRKHQRKHRGTDMAHRKGALKAARQDADDAPQQRGAGNLFDSAYLKLEELLVNCTLKPGRFLTVQELQDLPGFGRPPVHAAVNRLATDTLIIIRPRHGLQVAPIDLTRERLLLALRRDIARFVVCLAAARASLSPRHQ